MPEALAVESHAPAPVDGDALYEVIDGKVVEKPAMGASETFIAMTLLGLLYKSGVAEALGRPTAEMLYKIDRERDLKRRPDVSFVSYERWPRRRPVPAGEAWDVIPDLAVEVIGPSNSAVDVVKKIKEYFRAGVWLAWVIYPVEPLVYVYASPTDIRVLQPGDDLDGGPVIPGFRVAVTDLFEHAGDDAEGAPAA